MLAQHAAKITCHDQETSSEGNRTKPSARPLPGEILDLARQMEEFEASESEASIGTGSRREGDDFERLVARPWYAFGRVAAGNGAGAAVMAGDGSHRYTRFSLSSRSLYLPSAGVSLSPVPPPIPTQWLRIRFP